MGEAASRGTREERVAAAEALRRKAWAEEMVADAEAIVSAAYRSAEACVPPLNDAPSIEERQLRVTTVSAVAHEFAVIAAQRAVAADLLDALTDDDEGDEYEPTPDVAPPAPAAPPTSPPAFSLVAPKPKP